ALLESERQRADQSEMKYAEVQETLKKMKFEETEKRGSLDSDRECAAKSEKQDEALDRDLTFEETKKMAELKETSIVNELESAIEASNAALSIVKETIVSTSDADNIDSLTPKEESQKAELDDTFVIKEHESTIESSDAALSITKEAVVSMKDTDNINSLTPKQENQKVC
ncbi:hypothetical protein M8C21_020412, partial [Ambrosia artemisiifolia]